VALPEVDGRQKRGKFTLYLAHSSFYISYGYRISAKEGLEKEGEREIKRACHRLEPPKRKWSFQCFPDGHVV